MPMNLPVDFLATRVLILGAGLAGLRAAWAAGEILPRGDVLVAALAAGPSGSSFANPNRELGIQVCLDDAERADFAAEAIRIAPPGRIDPELAALVAAESRDRFKDLLDLGVPVRRAPDGSPARQGACFSGSPPRACVLTDLAATHDLLRAKSASLRVGRLDGHRLAAILTDPGQTPPRVLGAAFLDATDSRLLIIGAAAVVAALGGPAPLFAVTQAGPGNPGHGLALLRRAGVELVNAPFLQFMWGEMPGKVFWSPAGLAAPGLTVSGRDGPSWVPEEVFGGERLRELAASRAGHCPRGHGLADEELDVFLAARRGPDGTVTLIEPGGAVRRLTPMAHAGNGGAVIDAQGATRVAGLYAAGECASGMHGANRLGGAMVAATQVFGARAGAFAARFDAPDPQAKLLRQAAREFTGKLAVDRKARGEGLAALGQALQLRAIAPSPLSPSPPLLPGLDQDPEDMDYCLGLALETARLITG